jgi:hypothetical protein
MEEKRGSFHYRSLFWPILLIGVGIFWLLGNLDILPDVNFRFLFRLWPVALIAIGLDILFARRSPVIGALIGLGAVGLVIALVFFAPDLGIETSGDLKTLEFSEPLAGVEDARVVLDLERYPTTVDSAAGSNFLIEAVLDTFADVNFNTRGESSKTVTVDPVSDPGFNFNWFDSFGQNATWEISLSPDVPMDLSISVGSGSATLELGDLDLTDLVIDGGSGSTDVSVPASSSSYDVNMDGGSGSFDVRVERGADIDATLSVGSGSWDVQIGSDVDAMLDIDGGSGSVTIRIDGDVGVRVVVRDGGSGNVRVPGSFDLVDDMDDNDDDTGVWESDNYDNATHTVEIAFDPGSGSFSIR